MKYCLAGLSQCTSGLRELQIRSKARPREVEIDSWSFLKDCWTASFLICFFFLNFINNVSFYMELEMLQIIWTNPGIFYLIYLKPPLWVMPKYRFGDLNVSPLDHVTSNALSLKRSTHFVVIILPFICEAHGEYCYCCHRGHGILFIALNYCHYFCVTSVYMWQ